MALWTKLQKQYVRDIENNLKVTFTGKPTRMDASLFIREHREANMKFKIKHKIEFRPTGKQLRLIKDIEDTLEVEFKGRTVKSASDFIREHISEYSCRMDIEKKIKRYYNSVASKISAYQIKRKGI